MSKTLASSQIAELEFLPGHGLRLGIFCSHSDHSLPSQSKSLSEGWAQFPEYLTPGKVRGSPSHYTYREGEMSQKRTSLLQRALQGWEGSTLLTLSGRSLYPMALPPQGHTQWKQVFRVSGSDQLFRAGQTMEGRTQRGWIGAGQHCLRGQADLVLM